jgi:hypothetical protein
LTCSDKTDDVVFAGIDGQAGIVRNGKIH